MDEPTTIHSGRAFIHNGCLYYSPNSHRRVTPPSRKDDNVYRFHSVLDCCHERFIEPEWWSPIYGWLSFVPKSPEWGQNELFQHLNSVKAHLLENGWRGIGTERLAQWTTLEDTLFLIATKLAKLTRTRGYLKPSPILSLQPHLAVYNEVCANEKVKRIRDWLFMWMGLVSFYVARANHLNLNWMCQLHAEGIDPTILDQINQSLICDFTGKCNRAGVFLDYLRDDSDHFPVEFFVKHNVPVWYIWSDEQAVAHRKKGTPLHLLPTQKEIEKACSTILVPLPRPIQIVGQAHPAPISSGNDYENQRSAHIATKPWEPFFEERRTQIEKKNKTYTIQEKQALENKRKNPPRRKKTKVYVWDWSQETDAIELTRQKISLSEAKDLWDLPDHQKRYCPYFNEWDICEYFGLDSDVLRKENELHAELVDELNNAHRSLDVRSYDVADHEELNNNRNCFNSMGVLADKLSSHGRLLTSVEWVPDNLMCCLYFRYGFIMPVHPTTPSLELSEKHLSEWKQAMRCIFRSKDTPITIAEGNHTEISSFLLSLLNKNMPNPLSFDLSPSSPYAIQGSNFWERFQQKGSWFLINQDSFVDGKNDSWRIALTNIVDALFAFRVLAKEGKKAVLTRACLIKKLVKMCIPFHTLGEGLSCSMETIYAEVSKRDPAHQFTVAEFDNYLLIRKTLVLSSHGRAALLAGGIASRLAQEHIDVEEAAHGPSKDVLEEGIGHCWEDPNGTIYADDEFLPAEYGILCGEYETKTNADGKNSVYLSWWPPQHLWMRPVTGAHPGYWTEENEQWYQGRIRDIRAGKAKPLSSSKWLEWLRGWRKIQAISTTLEVAAKEILSN
ncbi:hypothetical protein CVT24_001480 [Panaeolus cyanescens]|uniref:Uncharacterized protein n=1 Tax=Panaeolus cyanescens TaxID=181874 RepID=A0A409VT32_9AGAR|nr:hypothetical protein CVT24_001480 [Panaeolus cyanescens]